MPENEMPVCKHENFNLASFVTKPRDYYEFTMRISCADCGVEFHFQRGEVYDGREVTLRMETREAAKTC